MAMDFPASPSVGQQVTFGTQTYIWDGTAWNIIPQMSAAMAQDNPPANPAVGQFWWRSTNGQLYVYVNDGNSSQWVQAAGQGITPAGEEKLDSFTWNNSTSTWTKTDLDAFVFLRIAMEGYFNGGIGSHSFQVSADNGSSWVSSGTAYGYEYLGAQSGAPATPASGTGTTGAMTTNFMGNWAGQTGGGGNMDLDIKGFNKSHGMLARMHVAQTIGGTGAFSIGHVTFNAQLNAPRNAIRGIANAAFTGTLVLFGVRG